MSALRGRRPADLVLPRAVEFAAKGLLREGTELWAADPHLIRDAIEKVEQAWALAGGADTAVQLATMYDLVNRHQDALVVLREASHADPHHALLRHHAAITLLRHGTPDDVDDFFASVLRIDPDDAFARFVKGFLDSYDPWVDRLASAIDSARDGRQPFVITCPVWGQPYSSYFVRYLCATLLATNNLPELAKRYAPHVVIFTTAETETYLRSEPLFARLGEYAQLHFIHYSDAQVNYGKVMEAHYGREKVHYSTRSLAFYYARSCKFVLMSCAHYVALAAGRATDSLVSCQVADLVLSDWALPRMADRLTGDTSAVLFHAIQVHGKIVRPILDNTVRRDDGALDISSEAITKLLIEHMPERNFVESDRPLDIPLRICWRVGEEGILVHGNHYHPIALRPAKFAHPLRLTIDPVDSRFVDRSSLELGNIHLVPDASIVGLSVDDDPLLDQAERGGGARSIADFALWLWGYWGRLRGTFFRHPVRFGQPVTLDVWNRTERSAIAMVDAIASQAGELDAQRETRKSWRLPGGGV
ncbi:MAG: hypothetical protein K2X72_24265 [Reyranella sp.]|nr:hypothetical protein [Reyranella sp.]